MPKIAFLPIFMLWFGVFTESKILMVAFNAIFPVIVASWAGTQGVEKFITWSALSLGTGRRRILWEIVLPAALPTVFTGLQLALPISLIVEIICEMAMGGRGLGASLMDSMRLADSLGVFSSIVAIALAGSALLKIMELIRHRVLTWHGESFAA
jgi:ABC-type nitrate/sulfonate/bicarbonate transport system permease component